MKLLIDGDILLHRWAYANQFGIDWENDGNYVEVANPDRAKEELTADVENLLKLAACKEYVFCISSDFNFRYKVLKSYKHNRSGEKPQLYEVLKAYAIETFNTLSWKRLEADDLMGILSTRDPEHCIIATLDKDLDQIPGWHYNWNRKETYRVTLDYGNWWFLRQVLTGDATDGYKGCPKIGPRKAERILEAACSGEDFNDFNVSLGWAKVVETYEKAKLTEADALQQARVARILQNGEYDEVSQQPILWKPPM